MDHSLLLSQLLYLDGLILRLVGVGSLRIDGFGDLVVVLGLGLGGSFRLFLLHVLVLSLTFVL